MLTYNFLALERLSMDLCGASLPKTASDGHDRAVKAPERGLPLVIAPSTFTSQILHS